MQVTYEYSNAVTAGMIGMLAIGSVFYALKPKRIVLLYVALLLVFTGTLYGVAKNPGIKPNEVLTVYSRGVGQLGISIINIYLIILFIFSMLVLKLALRPQGAQGDPILAPSVFLSLAYVIYSTCCIPLNITMQNVISMYGVFNILNMVFFYVILKHSLTDEEDLERFGKLFVSLCAFMAIYGLARIPLGGDPANYYATFEEKSVSLSYFDFGQSALFCIAGIYVFLQGRLTRFSLTRIAVILLCFANILFSYRRNCWIGLLVVLLWYMMTTDLRKKVALSFLGIVVALGALAIAQARFTGEKNAQDASLISDITNAKGEVSFKTGRFAELHDALVATMESPFIGLGPWGMNKEFTVQRGDVTASFVHSSLVHMFMKMGLLGFIPYMMMLIRFPIWWLKESRRSWNNKSLRSIAEAFFCGFLFWLPDIMFGTPIINFRHLQLLAMSFAIPIIASHVDIRMQNAWRYNAKA